MIVQVKQKHINKGQQASPCDCPIALAIKEALDVSEDERVSVDDDEVLIFAVNDELVRAYRPTKKMVRFIERFDDKGKNAVKPTTFRLERDDR
jgi:hypothetical protein